MGGPSQDAQPLVLPGEARAELLAAIACSPLLVATSRPQTLPPPVEGWSRRRRCRQRRASCGGSAQRA
eukprot:11123320-Alexandrium_andersonii.AAC.1